MWISNGVQMIKPHENLAAIEHLENVVQRGGVIHVVDTFAKPYLATSSNILRELAFSLGVVEWYGYEPSAIFKQAIVAFPREIVHVVVLCLLPTIFAEVSQTIVPALAQASNYAYSQGKRFYVCLFSTAIANPLPRL